MSFRRIDLADGGTSPDLPDPSMPALGGLEADGPHQALAALDTLLSSGVRVHGEAGLRGGTAFTIPDGEDTTSASRKYFDRLTPRVVCRTGRVLLPPGSFLGLDVLALPSGVMQVYDADLESYVPDGRGGTVELDVTYTWDGGSITASCAVEPQASSEDFGGIPAAGHDALEGVLQATAIPTALVQSLATLEDHTLGPVEAAWVLSYVGSPRIVDLAVVERTRWVVGSTSSEWPTAFYSQPSGQVYESLPSDYPVVQLGSLDPAGGTESIWRALLGAGRRLGPIIAWHSVAAEHTASVLEWISGSGGTGDDEAPFMTGGGVIYVDVGFATAASSVLPGFQIGHYARQIDHGDEFLDARTGVLPVQVAVYARSDDGTFQVRTGNDEWSAIEVPILGGAWQWHIVAGWLEVGLSPEDAPIVRFFIKADTTWEYRYAVVALRL